MHFCWFNAKFFKKHRCSDSAPIIIITFNESICSFFIAIFANSDSFVIIFNFSKHDPILRILIIF